MLLLPQDLQRTRRKLSPRAFRPRAVVDKPYHGCIHAAEMSVATPKTCQGLLTWKATVYGSLVNTGGATDANRGERAEERVQDVPRHQSIVRQRLAGTGEL